jgi:hypothetical protein
VVGGDAGPFWLRELKVALGSRDILYTGREKDFKVRRRGKRLESFFHAMTGELDS